MPSQVNNLARCASYEDAVKLFATPALRGVKWAPNERPLGSRAQGHYRVKQMLDGSFCVYLYNTCMARYYKPEGDERREEYSWDSRVTSTGFMYHVVRMSYREKYATTDGRRVWVPITGGGVVLRLVGDKLDVSRSNHPVQYVYRLSVDDKATRKEFRAVMGPLVSMAAIRYKDVPTPNTSGYRARRDYGPFTSPKEDYKALTMMRHNSIGSTEFIEAFMDASEDVVIYAKGRAAYDEREEPGLDMIEKSLMTWAMKTMRVNKKNERVALPMFPEVK